MCCRDYGIGQKKVRLLWDVITQMVCRCASVGTLSLERSSHPAVRHDGGHAAASPATPFTFNQCKANKKLRKNSNTAARFSSFLLFP